MNDTVLFEVKDHVAIITLNRPEVGNVINPAMMEGIKESVKRVSEDDDIRVAIVTASGDDFCRGFDMNVSGQDIVWNLNTRRARAKEEIDMWMSVWESPKPFIAAISGECIGGGTQLPMVADCLICTENARIGNTEMAWGMNYSINFAMDGYKLPLNKAKEYFLTGRSFTARELEQMGVANRVVADKSELMDAAMLLARQMCEVLPCVVTANKQVLNQGVENMGLYSTLAFARELFGLIRLNGCDASPEIDAYWKECKELGHETALANLIAKKNILI